jgi:hypothetical protein
VPCGQAYIGNDINLKGTGFQPGLVTITVYRSNGNVVSTAVADATGTFTDTFNPTITNVETDLITATQPLVSTPVQASVRESFVLQPP